LLALSQVETDIAGPQILNVTNTLYGIISKSENHVFHVHAPYEGIVQSVLVNTGDKVSKGRPVSIATGTMVYSPRTHRCAPPSPLWHPRL
jgi:acetyl/propionyl-CoA carboxylase alpha subunit